MRPHHTKNKGDLGVMHAQLDLAKKGYRILLPQSEHEWFDLVAYKDDTFIRVQVKYRSAYNGVLIVQFKSVWSDIHGRHVVRMDKKAVDLICVFCQDTERCYYIDPRRYRTGVLLRITPTKNRQAKRVLYAEQFTEIPDPLAQSG